MKHFRQRQTVLNCLSCFAFAERLWWAEPECNSLEMRNSAVSGDGNNALVDYAAKIERGLRQW